MTSSRINTAGEPLERAETLGDRIYGDLVAQLKVGAIDRGRRLVDVDLARTYGTSRMPVRDALLRLVNEGYLVGTTRGFCVPHLADSDIREIFEVRRLLEPHAASAAARDLDKTAERRLTAALRSARAAQAVDDATALIHANIEFRGAWLAAVANRRLADTLARFADQVHAVRLNTLSDAGTRRVVLRGLTSLHDAFLRRDGDRAGRQMSAFIDAAEHAFFAARSSDPATGPANRGGPRLVHSRGRR